MKEAINHAGPTVKIVDSPIPNPNGDQVLIKVVVSGSSPKDWKMPEWAVMSGDDGMSEMIQRAKKGVNQGMILRELSRKSPDDRVAVCAGRIVCGICYCLESYNLPPFEGA
ncbi:hypothetical protein AJ78_08259 [Emergomyces pasteurianus Ep9510]|uniref:Uncharacterized protein n=1 Tax=Emergomyces pasteurianus Ep9510 TaxID=1447872 RepID=A0A1J9Q6P9_9EURO|nr:hypothetical protein AJ78_08259 [Emergomyces pasteurianus Ep9510]